jgi:hypothetical protein
MLVQQLQPQLVRPPVAVRPADAGDVVERALAFVSHNGTFCHKFLLFSLN